MAGIYSLETFVRMLREGHGDPHFIWLKHIKPIVDYERWTYGDVPTDPKELRKFVEELLVAHQSDIEQAWRDY